LQRSFGFKHRISFEISKGFKAGLENKDLFGRYKQAQEYLRKAKETYQAILVNAAHILRDGTLSSPLSRSNSPWACIIND